jgi:hypothetical protein
MGVHRVVVLAAILFVAGCMQPPEPGEATVLALAGGWSERDATEAQAACSEWRAFSEGRLSCEIRPEGSEADYTLRRGQLPVGNFYYLDAGDRTVTVDIDQARADGWSDAEIRTLIEHAMGRAVGMRKHEEDGVLSIDRMKPGFTSADLAVCRSAGFCR